MYETESGERAHLVYQVPRTQEDLLRRVAMMRHSSILAGTSSVYMALMDAREALSAVSPA